MLWGVGQIQSLVTAMNHIISNAGSTYSETSAILKSMFCVRNNATGSQPLVKTFYTIYLGCLWTFTFLMEQSFLRNFTLECLPVLLMIWKFFFFEMYRLRHIFMGALTYVVLKSFSSLTADWNVVSNPEFFILFQTSSHIFCAKNMSECAIFYSLRTFRFNTEASFNGKISFIRSGEKAFKSLNNFIVRECGIF